MLIGVDPWPPWPAPGNPMALTCAAGLVPEKPGFRTFVERPDGTRNPVRIQRLKRCAERQATDEFGDQAELQQILGLGLLEQFADLALVRIGLLAGGLDQRVQPDRLDDVAGLVVMRIVAALANEAADAVVQQVAAASAIDLAMQKGVNYPRGPIA